MQFMLQSNWDLKFLKKNEKYQEKDSEIRELISSKLKNSGPEGI